MQRYPMLLWKRKFQQWLPTIPKISGIWTNTSQLKSVNIKKNTTTNTDANLGPGLM